MSEYKEVLVCSISAPEEPLRLAMERGALEELAASIRSCGLLQPLVVKVAPHGWEVVAGHRRWLACQMAGLERVPVVVIEGSAEAERVVQLSENVLRADLTPMEEAHAIRSLREVLGLSIREVSIRMGKSEMWVRGRLELLTWPEVAVRAIAEGRASVGALKPLMDLEDEAERDRLLGCAIESGATGRVTASWVAGMRGEAAPSFDDASVRSRVSMPLAEYVVHMPCFACRETLPALDLRVVRICDRCLEDITSEAAALSHAAAVGGESPQS